MDVYSMEQGPSAQLVHAALFKKNPKLAPIACVWPISLYTHLTHVTVSMLFKRQNCTRLYYYPWQLVPDTHHPLYERIAPLDPFVSLPSHLKPVPSSFRLPYLWEKILTIWLIYAPHYFIDLNKITPQPPVLQRKKFQSIQPLLIIQTIKSR